MKLTEPQQRMLRVMPLEKSIESWRLRMTSQSYSSGYRVIEALFAKGLIDGRGDWYALTDAGRAVLGSLVAGK